MSEVAYRIDQRANGSIWLRPPGHWTRVRREDGSTAVRVTCPRCGSLASLLDHAINPDGSVHPAIACPAWGCSFHAFIHLVGWLP